MEKKLKNIQTFEQYTGAKLDENNEFNTIKSGDIIKFVSKSDKNDIINAEILKVDKDEMRIYFKNIDYPNVGTQNMTEYSISKYWNIKKIN